MFQEWSLMSNIILKLLALLTLLVFIWVIYAVLYSIFTFIFSWGNEEKIKKAWSSIRYAILGFILTLIILIAVPWFLRAIKVPWYKQYTSTNVFINAKSLVNIIVKIFQNNNGPVGTDTNSYLDNNSL